MSCMGREGGVTLGDVGKLRCQEDKQRCEEGRLRFQMSGDVLVMGVTVVATKRAETEYSPLP